VNRRIPFLLLILVLLVAPVANAWCSTVCVAAAISSGCAHGLQPTDDLPMAKAVPAAQPAAILLILPFDFSDPAPLPRPVATVPPTPLRL